MIEIGAMAASLVGSFLLPLVRDGAKELGEQLRKRTTESAADGLVSMAKRLWDRVRGASQSSDDKDIVDMFERRPEVMREALEKVVRQQLERDEGFRQEAEQLLEAEAQPGVVNWKLMGEVVGALDARHATISGGTVAGVVYHAGSQGPAATSDPPRPVSPDAGPDPDDRA